MNHINNKCFPNYWGTHDSYSWEYYYVQKVRNESVFNSSASCRFLLGGNLLFLSIHKMSDAPTESTFCPVLKNVLYLCMLVCMWCIFIQFVLELVLRSIFTCTVPALHPPISLSAHLSTLRAISSGLWVRTGSLNCCPASPATVSWRPFTVEKGEAWEEAVLSSPVGGVFCTPGLFACFFLRRVSIQLLLWREAKEARASELSRIFFPEVISSPKPSWCANA